MAMMVDAVMKMRVMGSPKIKIDSRAMMAVATISKLFSRDVLAAEHFSDNRI